MGEPIDALNPDRPESTLRAVALLVETADLACAAESAGVDVATLRHRLDSDPEFIAAVNRARQDRADRLRADRLRADVRKLATEAVAKLRELLTDPDTPPAVRLRTALAILGSTQALQVETIGPTSAVEVRSAIQQNELLSFLGA